jgi:hypothetical protein
MYRSSFTHSVCLSSTEAEFKALHEGGKNAIFYHNFLKEIGVIGQRQYSPTNPVKIYTDSSSAKKVAEQDSQHKLMKHMAVKYHWTREKTQLGAFAVEWTSRDNILCDFLVHPNHVRDFKRQRDMTMFDPSMTSL